MRFPAPCNYCRYPCARRAHCLLVLLGTVLLDTFLLGTGLACGLIGSSFVVVVAALRRQAWRRTSKKRTAPPRRYWGLTLSVLLGTLYTMWPTRVPGGALFCAPYTPDNRLENWSFYHHAHRAAVMRYPHGGLISFIISRLQAPLDVVEGRRVFSLVVNLVSAHGATCCVSV